MQQDEQTTIRKALTLNLDESRYGTFAEIGAGQEVARHFFQAGHASQTVAKTMSAYDKIFSDEIYGKGCRFVSCERLDKMLDHEYQLLHDRLGPIRGDKTCFFAYANTVATSSHEDSASGHSWMGLRFQSTPDGPPNEIVIHVRMLDRLRLQQQKAIGILGVNLLFASFYLIEMSSDFISSLVENLGLDRIEIDYIKLSGPDIEHIDSRLLSLELVKQGITRAQLFGPDGLPKPISDTLYGQPVLHQRGRYRPMTSVNMEILERSQEQFKKFRDLGSCEPLGLLEITMNGAKDNNQLGNQDFLDRVDTIAALGQHVLVTNFRHLVDVKTLLRRYTENEIALVIGASSLEILMDRSNYDDLPGGILEGFGSMFDDKTTMLIFPYKTKDSCLTTEAFFPEEETSSLFQHLLKNNKIVDILGCDDVASSEHSETVRKMLAEGDSLWEELVPAKVRDMIKKRKLFGYSKA